MANVRALFGPAALVLGSLVGLGLAVPAVLGAQADAELQKVQGTVLESSADRSLLLVRRNSPNAPTHETEIQVRYAYEVDGTRYESDRYAWDEHHELVTDAEQAEARFDAYAPGSTVQVLVDPAHPEQAVRAPRELERPLAVGIISAAGLLIGLGWLAAGLRARAPRA